WRGSVNAFHTRSTGAAKSAVSVIVSASGSVVTAVTGMSLSFSPARVSRVVVRGFGADLLGEQVVEPGDARPPQLLVAREQRAGASDHRRVRPDETLPPLGPF